MTSRAILKRRQFLQGFGGAAALAPFIPLMEARGATSGYPRRLVIFYTNTGMTGRYPGNWKPAGGQTDFTFPAGSILETLAPYKDKLIVLQGVDMTSFKDSPQMGGHPTGNLNMLTGIPGLAGTQFNGGGNESGGWNGGASLDQALAQSVGKDTPFASLLLGVAVKGSASPHTRMSFSGPSMPVPPENSPYALFNRVFGGGITGSVGDPKVLERLRAEQRSVLDVVNQDLNAVRGKLGAGGKQKLDAHLTALRAVETRLSQPTPPPGAGCQKPAPLGTPIDVMSENNIPLVGEMHMKLAAAALACGQTKIVTLQWGNAPTGHRMPWLTPQLSTSWHSLSHAATTDLAAQNELDRAARWLAGQYRAFLDLLKAVPEGSGTMLDNTTVLWCTENARSNNHDWRNMPYVLAGGMGGAFRTGRYLSFTPSVPHNRLLTSLAQGMGMTSLATFGSPNYGTGPLAGLA